MKGAVVISSLYFVLLTGIFFSYANSRESFLQTKMEQANALDKRLKEDSEAWVRSLIPSDYRWSLPGFLEKPVVGTPSSVSRPSNLLSAAVMSACNPRINPCF